jgi:GWxTD domain-containing protein
MSGRAEEAIGIIKGIIACDPDITDAYYSLGNICFKERRFRLCLKSLRGLAYNGNVIKKALLAVIFIVMSLAGLVLSFSTQRSIKDLPGNYRKWLEEEVVYIITPKEKEVFLKLENDRERELFIGAFWKQRDPNPNTPENEFKKEHFRRIAYANQWFGRDSPGPGWRSAMGRIYIMLGEANAVEKFENLTEVFPTIIWFYEGKMEYGLPNAFNVVFFKPQGDVEWKLYTPIRYGPQALLIQYAGDQTDYAAAYQQLMGIEPAIASVSLSLIPGESSQAIPSPSIASEILIQSKIPSAPREKVKDAYAENFFKYKDTVGVEYTANFIDNDFSASVIRDASGTSFVHYLIEPRRFSLEREGNRFYTTLQINILVSDPKGLPVFQDEKSIPVELTGDQVEKIKDRLFSFQDLFPLVAGTYRVNILVKNMVSKEFTSAETQVTVPAAAGPGIEPLILANRLIENSSYRGMNKPYLIREVQLVPSPRNDFGRADTLHVFCQVTGLTEALKAGGSLEFTIADDARTAYTAKKPLTAYPKVPDIFEAIPLTSLEPSIYKLRVALLDADGREVGAREAQFFVSLAEALPRPFIMSRPLPPSGDPVFANILGNQLLNNKDLAGAGPLLEKAYKDDPASVRYALDYCKWLFATGDPAAVLRIGEPFMKGPRRADFAGLLGQASQAAGDPDTAIAYYQEYLAHFGTNINVMNSIGECQIKLGRNAEALAILEKSLQLSPNQEKIRKLVESLKASK